MRSPSRENIMLHLREIGKSFASGGGGSEQNKIRKKVERLVLAFKRVAKKFHRRMETLVAHRWTGVTNSPLLSTSSLRISRSQSLAWRNNPQRPLCALNRTEVPRNKTCFRQAGNFICLRCACSRKRTKDTSESRFNQIDRPCLIANTSGMCRRTSPPSCPRLSFSEIIFIGLQM